jgi:hypothetical protein
VRILLMTSLLLLSMTALADPWMAMSYVGVPWSPSDTNLDPAPETPFNLYLVVFDTELAWVTGYEMALQHDGLGLFYLSVTGPDGWSNDGEDDNHRCQFVEPLPMPLTDEVVLASFGILYLGDETVDIYMGPSVPSSVDGAGPAVRDGSGEWHVCGIPGSPLDQGLVATIFGDGVDMPSPIEGRTWSQVKRLFD